MVGARTADGYGATGRFIAGVYNEAPTVGVLLWRLRVLSRGLQDLKSGMEFVQTALAAATTEISSMARQQEQGAASPAPFRPFEIRISSSRSFRQMYEGS